MSTPRRYQFDNHLPDPVEPPHLPVYRAQPLPEQQPVPQVVHIHHAPPDRTVQRLALGAGMGGGMVAAGVYFGPLLIAAMASMAVSLAIVAIVVAVSVWGVVTIVRSVGGPDGKAAADAIRKGRKH
jgi:hypothetical protein